MSTLQGARLCTRPVRLRGRVDAVDTTTGQLRTLVDSTDRPLLISCRNRRATTCPACSQTYKHDAWHLIAAGLRGGKGAPASVATHPHVFATFTAPSFGPVHSRREGRRGPRRCQRRLAPCSHGSRCTERHDADDSRLGRPICPECFDYAAAVLWNANVGPLWNRTTIGVRRILAQEISLPVRVFRNFASVSFAKVVEYQARGIVHLHVVIRIDGADQSERPPTSVTPSALAYAVRTAAHAAEIAVAHPDGGDRLRVRWGNQVDVRVLRSDDDESGAIAAYVAKYATKSTEVSGALDRRIRTAAEIERLAVDPHIRQLVRTCWQLGGKPEYEELRLRAWAHSLGYRGHWTTKSRSYSTTFTALRAARSDHHAPQLSDHEVVLRELRYAGRGYLAIGR